MDRKTPISEVSQCEVVALLCQRALRENEYDCVSSAHHYFDRACEIAGTLSPGEASSLLPTLRRVGMQIGRDSDPVERLAARLL